ncbi:MAG: hypothetical protein FJ122_11930 [Deltaproteobacteria bacterium]|nr:hypothetical protein [Deltaproteobacteria bacterium]
MGDREKTEIRKGMKRTASRRAGAVRPVILPLLCILGFLASPPFLLSSAEADIAGSAIGFKFKPNRPLMQEIPEIPMGDAEWDLLSSGKPVTRLLDRAGGLKACYMRIFLPVDPPTIWHIITDIDHFSMVAPQYPLNGSLTDKRRTFMPYVFESAACENGRYLYQLIVMPLIAPRHYTIRRFLDRAAFPWESKWSQEPKMRCQDTLSPAMEKYRTEAVITTKNEGSWRLSPLPRQFVKGKEDLRKTDCIYYLDSNPGGNLSSFMGVVNKVTEVVLPALADNLLYHTKQWDDHMRKHHSSRQYEEWKAQVAAYMSERGYVP